MHWYRNRYVAVGVETAGGTRASNLAGARTKNVSAGAFYLSWNSRESEALTFVGPSGSAQALFRMPSPSSSQRAEEHPRHLSA